MKYDCDLIRDVAGLHKDELLSEASRRIVAEHLRECPDCRSYYEEFNREPAFLTMPQCDGEVRDAAGRIKKYRRGQLACFGSFAAVMLALLLPWTGVPGISEVPGVSMVFRGQPLGFAGALLLILGIWFPFKTPIARRWCGWCGWGALLGAEIWRFLTGPVGYTVGVDFWGIFSLDIPSFGEMDLLCSLESVHSGFYLSVAATVLLGVCFHRLAKISG